MITLNNTIELVKACWLQAEKVLEEEIYNNYPNSDEEFITRYFHGKLSQQFKIANDKKMFEATLYDDIFTNSSLIDSYKLQDFTKDFVAIPELLLNQITLHNKSTEKISGADLGIVLSRPAIFYDSGNIYISNTQKTGILCQAKLKRKNQKWGKLTNNQKNIFSKYSKEEMKYLSLLLYSFSDNERRIINPFSWQPCVDNSFTEIEQWINNGNFPTLKNTKNFLGLLQENKIGTNDQKIIDEQICKLSNVTLCINLTWKDGDKPSGTIIHINPI